MREYSGHHWQIWIDTGGTFTDCVAVSPAGQWHRTKVLSSSFLRGKITEQITPKKLTVNVNWGFDLQLVMGYFFRMVGTLEFCQIVGIEGNALLLSAPVVIPPGITTFEITTHEEAPVLASRLVTQTTLGSTFPLLMMRLGTTKGTNALLERKGAPVRLYVTKGFKDILRIGTQQRPHLFQIAIPEPTLLYAEVEEIPERLDAAGQVLTPLSATLTFVPPNTSVAVALLHSYQNPVHEQQLKAQLAAQGVTYISTSAELYAGINYLKRTQTAVVNAYLQPILADYLHNIARALGENATIGVMTSAGGLVSTAVFQAKDSLLSGPAGGMVGAAAIAQRLGFERCLTFDMGGTSTDTARYDGRLDLQFTTRIEDIELHNPTLAIETVAAGGGSVCFFDGQKLGVGPESAGAAPGPACYGAGGPLTITDVNLLLGKLDVRQFGIPVHPEKSREALRHIQLAVQSATNVAIKEMDLLKGFEQIANEKMAEAIRRISVGKGFNPADYPLLTFGGAGGLHGCQLAEILGIKTVILPYDAGLLSAYGMGQARIERILTRQIIRPLNEFALELNSIVVALKTEGEALLALDNVVMDSDEVTLLLYLRFKGQESTIEVQDAWEKETIEQQFRQKYQQLFGYCPDTLSIEVESVKLIVGESRKASSTIEKITPTHAAAPLTTNNNDYAIYDWERLPVGAYFEGPAVLLNATSTSFIPPRWHVTLAATRDAVVTYHPPSENSLYPQLTNGPENEVVELELFTNRFMAIAEEMGAQLQRTAFSVNVKERLDFSCALLDTDAQLLVNAPHIPVHLGSLGVCARLVREKLHLGVGDVIITNHPRYGGSHLPDVTLLAGVFTPEAQLIGYVINRAHHAEIGGRTPGSMPPDATTLLEEGVVILPTYLVKNGQMQWQTVSKLFTDCPYPTRSLTDNLADITAALASLRTGEAALQNLVFQHGLTKVHKYMGLLKKTAKDALQQALIPYQNQCFTATESLDDGHQIVVKIDVSANSEQSLLFDFTGSSTRHPHNLNANVSIINSAILYVLRLLVNQPIPLNEGLMQGVQIRLPDDSFLHPNFADEPTQCPAVVGGNTEVSQRLVDTLLKAFGLTACSQGTMNNFLFGTSEGPAPFGYYETICGGTGASEGAAGRSAVHQHMTNTRITDPEELERRYPVRLEEFSVRKNAGGNGRWRGGDGVIRRLTFLQNLRVTLITQHRVVAPYGLAGGEDGKPGMQTLTYPDGTEEALAGICTLEVAAGTQLCIETPGGGGYGH